LVILRPPMLVQGCSELGGHGCAEGGAAERQRGRGTANSPCSPTAAGTSMPPGRRISTPAPAAQTMTSPTEHHVHDLEPDASGLDAQAGRRHTRTAMLGADD